jgi:hypothetical protein
MTTIIPTAVQEESDATWNNIHSHKKIDESAWFENKRKMARYIDRDISIEIIRDRDR